MTAPNHNIHDIIQWVLFMRSKFCWTRAILSRKFKS